MRIHEGTRQGDVFSCACVFVRATVIEKQTKQDAKTSLDSIAGYAQRTLNPLAG